MSRLLLVSIGPVQDFIAAAHLARPGGGQPPAAIAVFDPRFGAAASHRPDWHKGQIIERSPPNDAAGSPAQ